MQKDDRYRLHQTAFFNAQISWLSGLQIIKTALIILCDKAPEDISFAPFGKMTDVVVLREEKKTGVEFSTVTLDYFDYGDLITKYSIDVLFSKPCYAEIKHVGKKISANAPEVKHHILRAAIMQRCIDVLGWEYGYVIARDENPLTKK